MTDEEAQALRRENQYLKQRVAQLEGDLADVSAQSERLAQRLDRMGAARPPAPPNPLAGGQ